MTAQLGGSVGILPLHCVYKDAHSSVFRKKIAVCFKDRKLLIFHKCHMSIFHTVPTSNSISLRNMEDRNGWQTLIRHCRTSVGLDPFQATEWSFAWIGCGRQGHQHDNDLSYMRERRGMLSCRCPLSKITVHTCSPFRDSVQSRRFDSRGSWSCYNFHSASYSTDNVSFDHFLENLKLCKMTICNVAKTLPRFISEWRRYMIVLHNLRAYTLRIVTSW